MTTDAATNMAELTRQLDAAHSRVDDLGDALQDAYDRIDELTSDAGRGITGWIEARHDREHSGALISCRDDVCDALTRLRDGRAV